MNLACEAHKPATFLGQTGDWWTTFGIAAGITIVLVALAWHFTSWLGRKP